MPIFVGLIYCSAVTCHLVQHKQLSTNKIRHLKLVTRSSPVTLIRFRVFGRLLATTSLGMVSAHELLMNNGCYVQWMLFIIRSISVIFGNDIFYESPGCF